MLISNDQEFKSLGKPEVALKKPAWQPCEISTKSQNIKTLEGEQVAQVGDMIVTGVKGERWPIPAKEKEAYDFKKENGKVFLSKKLALVAAIKTSEKVEVKLSWSPEPLIGKVGDIVVRYGKDDFGVVDKEIYNQTYASLQSVIQNAEENNQESLSFIKILYENENYKENLIAGCEKYGNGSLLLNLGIFGNDKKVKFPMENTR